MSVLTCDLQDKYADLWSQYNYIVYVVKGRKTWHTAHGVYDLREGSCVFIRKGAFLVEQFFDTEFCVMFFFLPDEFICSVLRSKSTPIHKVARHYKPVIAISDKREIQDFFHSMMPYFNAIRTPDQSLLELKFKELILLIADNPANGELLSYFYSMLSEPQRVSLQQIMEDNFCYNLSLEQFAKLTARSLSAFKRDFMRQYRTSPGKWLLEKRLNHTKYLLTHMGRTVTEAAYESGFESPSHFSRTFRRRFGYSPASVRHGGLRLTAAAI